MQINTQYITVSIGYWHVSIIYWKKYLNTYSPYMHVYACICTYFGFCLLDHPFSPSCFLQISAHQSPILVSIVSFQSAARRHSSMLLNPLGFRGGGRHWRQRGRRPGRQPQQQRCRHHLHPSWHWCPQSGYCSCGRIDAEDWTSWIDPHCWESYQGLSWTTCTPKSKDFKHRNSKQMSTRCYWINLIVSMQRILRRNKLRMLFTTITENLKWKTGTQAKAACRKYSKYSAHKRRRC